MIRLTEGARKFFLSRGIYFRPGPIPHEVFRTLLAEAAAAERRQGFVG